MHVMSSRPESTRKGQVTARSRNWSTRNRKPSPKSGPVVKGRHGHFRPPSDPPSHVVAPWNHLTLMKVYVYGSAGFATGLIIASDLGTWMKEQLGSDSLLTDNLLIRVNSISAWNLSGSYIGLSAYDYISSSQDDEAIGTYIDAGTKTHSPAVGFRWPMSTKMHAVSTSPNSSSHEALNERRVATIHCEKNEKILVHIDIQWKPNGEKMSLQYQLATIDTVQRSLNRIQTKMPDLDGSSARVKVENILPIPVYLPVPVREDEEGENPDNSVPYVNEENAGGPESSRRSRPPNNYDDGLDFSPDEKMQLKKMLQGLRVSERALSENSEGFALVE